MSQAQVAQLLATAQQYLKLGQYPKAIEFLQRAIAISPSSFLAHSLQGIAFQSAGQHDQAIVHLRFALQLNPGWTEGYGLLGTALATRGQHAAAAEMFAKLVKVRPLNVEALNNLGTVLHSLSRFDEAIVHLRKAIELRPGQAEIHNNLGNALLENGQTVEALAELEKAVALRPDYIRIYQGLGNSLISVGRVPEAIACFRKALSIDPKGHQIHSSLLMSLHYADEGNDNPRAVLDEHLAYDRAHIASLPRPETYMNDSDPWRPLRIGYFSPDFRQHSVSFFIEPILAHHDHSIFHITCYSDVTNPDAVTARLQRTASQWRPVAGMTDAQIAELIRADAIDILVDLSGHTGGGRMPLFGLKPAPIQATYLGYPDTTGLSTIDYRITDLVADPPGESDSLHTEKLIRLAPPFVCFQPPVNTPDVQPPPVVRNGYITFGSFNTLAKITPATIAMWSAAMRAVPESQILIKARGLQHAPVADKLAEVFLSHGIQRERLRFLGHETTTESHLARYHEVDIALDPFPYNGTTTTCEALWMGVPVITRSGQIHSARVGASLLTALNRTEWIAQDNQSFSDIAARLARDAEKLSATRALLRNQLQSSAILDAPGFTRRLEAAYRTMWMGRCK